MQKERPERPQYLVTIKNNNNGKKEEAVVFAIAPDHAIRKARQRLRNFSGEIVGVTRLNDGELKNV